MKNYSSDTSINRTSSIILWLVVCLLLIGLFGCEGEAVDNKQTEEYKRNHPSAFQIHARYTDIFPDNKTLLTDYGSPYWSNIAVYNTSTGTIHVIKNIKTKMNVVPSLSRDGKKIVFLGGEQGFSKNIYIINADGSGLRQITNISEKEREDLINAPSFSPDGNRIIFLRSHIKRDRAFPLQGGMHSAWDIYEIDIASGVERRLTNYNFYEASWPYYMADGKRFIFSGEGPYNPTGKGPKNFKEYEEKYQKNFIFIMDGKMNDLKPLLVNGPNSYRPSISDDDTILFISKTNEMDGNKAPDTQDLFLYKHGRIIRLTRLNSYIELARISRDGSCIIFTKRRDRKSRDYSNWVIKSDGTGLQEIKIPMDKLKR